MPFEDLKQRQSVMWGKGPYQRITETIRDIHERVIARLDPRPGERLLDLACGTGAVAEDAAARGADVTGVDLAPALIETARERAASVGSRSTTERETPSSSSFPTPASTRLGRRAG